MTARPPKPAELDILLRHLALRRKTYGDDKEAARKLIANGESKPDPKLSAAELAAWTSLATILMNLDETISKE